MKQISLNSTAAHPMIEPRMLDERFVRAYSRRAALDRVLGYFRSCAICGCAANPFPYPSAKPMALCCAYCDEALDAIQNRAEGIEQKGYPFGVSALFCWTPLTDALVRPILYSQKGGRQVEALREFAHRLSFEKTTKIQKGRILFVHPPAREGRPWFDHAAVLAHALALEWNGRVWQGLRRSAPQQTLSERAWTFLRHTDGQKHQTRSERARLRFERDGQELPGDYDRIIFVDDVITTGSTAMAAYMALGDPESFEVWTLAARPQLAGSRSI